MPEKVFLFLEGTSKTLPPPITQFHAGIPCVQDIFQSGGI